MIENGTRFGRLVVIEDLGCYVKEGTKSSLHYYKCKCDCGNEIITRDYSLLKGQTKSCGCLNNDIIKIGKPRKHNEHYVYENIVFVKFSNCNEYFICDLEDWNELKNYTWHKDNKGYAATSIHKKGIRMHRLILKTDIEQEIDHIKAVKIDNVCDNRKKNLRVCTRAENARNIKMYKDNKTGVKGVYKHSQINKYVAQIRYNGKTYHLGCFDTLEEAKKVREQKELELFGEFSPLK